MNSELLLLIELVPVRDPTRKTRTVVDDVEVASPTDVAPIYRRIECVTVVDDTVVIALVTVDVAADVMGRTDNAASVALIHVGFAKESERVVNPTHL